MRYLLVLTLAAGTCLSAQVRFSPEDIAVTIDGKPFTTFHYGSDANKPYLAPIRSASGKIITRRYPMQTIEGESRDHVHHRGLWFSYNDVNGIKFWENDPSYTKPGIGRVAVTNAEWKDASGILKSAAEWRDPKGKVLVLENREMTFRGDANSRSIDFVVTLTAAQDVTFGDTHDGLMAIRLAENFTQKGGGTLVDADGRTGMLNVWGKTSKWVDYTGQVDGERIGVAMFDSPKNPRPAHWHARDYGLFSANPMAIAAFDPDKEESHWKLPSGQKLTFRYKLVIHPGDAKTGRVADLYQEYVSK